MSNVFNNTTLLPYIVEGFVMDTDDPQQMGRLKVWCPGVDGETYDINTLPWAEYASPLAGFTNNFPAGRNKTISKGPVPYGFWSLPKLNAQVLVFFLNGEANRRFYFASFFDLQRNRGLPAGRNTSMDTKLHGPLTDTEEPLEPAHTNLKAAFGDLSNPIAEMLGTKERQVAEARTQKTGADGYSPSAADPDNYKESQSHCWVTPGHHMITMSDTDSHCRIRIKSCEGNQILMDDTNGRIYISSALGNSWVELNENGEVHVYSGRSVSVRAQTDINFYADNNINIEAGNEVNIISGQNMNMSSGSNINILSSGGSTVLSACANIDLTSQQSIRILSNDILGLKGTSGIIQTGAEIHLNGQSAPEPDCALSATSPGIIPTHEPFTRPVHTTEKK
jgi:hypothetical protein